MRTLLKTVLFLLLISGCAIRPEAKPPITQYYLQPDIKPQCPPSSTQKTVRLDFVNGVSSISTHDIIYTKSDLKAGSYLHSKWNQLPNRSITTALYTALKHNNVFGKLVHDNTLVRSDLTLKIEVLRFEHHFTDEDHSQVLIEFDAVLYDTQTQKLLASHLFRSEVQAETNNAKGGVKAFNQALGELLRELICWSAQESSKY